MPRPGVIALPSGKSLIVQDKPAYLLAHPECVQPTLEAAAELESKRREAQSAEQVQREEEREKRDARAREEACANGHGGCVRGRVVEGCRECGGGFGA